MCTSAQFDYRLSSYYYEAKSMGFVMSSPPPYLSLLEPSSSLLLAALTTGVSCAYADAGILDSTIGLLTLEESSLSVLHLLNVPPGAH